MNATALEPEEPLLTDEDNESDGPAPRLHSVGASTDPVKDYLRLIARVRLLTAEQEVELAKRIEAGLYAAHLLATTAHPRRYDHRELTALAQDGRRAKNQFTEANLRLVVSVAKRYTRRGLPFLDLIQEGNTGLIRAVEKFDYTKGFKFSTYATWWIKQGITRALADKSRTIRIPVHTVEMMNRVARTHRELLSATGAEPTLETLAASTGITVQRLEELNTYTKEPVSLDAALAEDGTASFGDLIVDSDTPTPWDTVAFGALQQAIHTLLANLTPREAGIISLRYGLLGGPPKTLEDIGRVYGVTRERIRQIEAKTMSKLRHPARSNVLQDYLDIT